MDGSDDPTTVLVVCQANETRSPLYAAALAAELARRDAPWEVVSAGVLAVPDRPARADVQAVAAELGLSLEAHRSRRLAPGLLTAAGLVVTAERAHRDHVAQLVPGLAARTFTATELATLLVGPPEVVGGPATPRAVAAAAHGRRPRNPRAATDLPDPTGRGPAAHRRLADEIARIVPPVADALGGPRPADAAGRAPAGDGPPGRETG